ncbi:MAG: hypothetical protein ABI683_02190 [Ginsengibacter sp.]
MPKIGLIFNGVWSQYTFAKAPKYKDIFELLYVYDLSKEKLDGMDALCIPFQSNQQALALNKELLYDFLRQGKKIFIEGDSSADWLDARWENRPINNYWWVTNPENPPVSQTDYTHPVYNGLKPRHACWHTHGAYTRIPDHASVIQRNGNGEAITWETKHYGGTLMATTLDPIVEHGIQQITHLDNYVDKLVDYLVGVKPQGKFKFDMASFN